MGYTDVILSQPPKGSFMKCKEMIGHRVVILGTHSIEEQPDTMNPGKTRQVATVDYVDLDDGQGGIIQWGAMVDKPGVVNKLRNQVNAIMGRIVLGDAKPGQSAPFILDDHQPGDAEFFTQVWMPANREALAGKQAQVRTQTAAMPPAAAQNAYAQPAAQQPMAAPVAAQPAMAGGYPAGNGQIPLPVAAQPAAHSVPSPVPSPVAAAVAGGQGTPYTPETMAAIERMIASGQLPGFPPVQ